MTKFIETLDGNVINLSHVVVIYRSPDARGRDPDRAVLADGEQHLVSGRYCDELIFDVTIIAAHPGYQVVSVDGDGVRYDDVIAWRMVLSGERVFAPFPVTAATLETLAYAPVLTPSGRVIIGEDESWDTLEDYLASAAKKERVAP